MLAKRIISCLDIQNGRVVKGINFQNLWDAGDPVSLAQEYNQAQADELVFLDITATNEKRKTVLPLVEKLARQIFIPFTIGGGIADLASMVEIVQAGADKVALNSFALKNPSLIKEGAKILGSQCIVIAIDAKKVAPKTWRVFSHAGKKDTGLEVLSWVKQVQDFGAGEILLTSMDRDGTKLGYDLELLQWLAPTLSIPIIASGGVGKLEHFAEVFEQNLADAALAASVFHQKIFSIESTKKYLQQKGIRVRISS